MLRPANTGTCLRPGQIEQTPHVARARIHVSRSVHDSNGINCNGRPREQQGNSHEVVRTGVGIDEDGASLRVGEFNDDQERGKRP